MKAQEITLSQYDAIFVHFALKLAEVEFIRRTMRHYSKGAYPEAKDAILASEHCHKLCERISSIIDPEIRIATQQN